MSEIKRLLIFLAGVIIVILILLLVVADINHGEGLSWQRNVNEAISMVRIDGKTLNIWKGNVSI